MCVCVCVTLCVYVCVFSDATGEFELAASSNGGNEDIERGVKVRVCDIICILCEIKARVTFGPTRTRTV